MDRRGKIIVSVVGIVIILLILIGVTYAYFLTNIRENTNTKSIEVTTANLIVDYGENTNVVQFINSAEPGYSVTKYFTATNNGNASVDYVATLDSVVNELTRQGDLEYTLTCASYLKSDFTLSASGMPSGDLDGTCNGVEKVQFPSTITTSIMVGNRISTTQVHYYVLTINYKEMGVDQSDDMNKTFSALVNIKDIKEMQNPYQVNTLAYNIINNSLTVSNGTSLVMSPPTKVAEEVSSIDEKVLSITRDDLGISYYFRGAVEDNYLSYSNMCFRIVRIEGDGSVKLVLANPESVCDETLLSKERVAFFGMYVNPPFVANSESAEILEKFLNGEEIQYIDMYFPDMEDQQKTKQYSALDQSKLKNDSWCLENTNNKYDDITGIYLTDEDVRNQLENDGYTHFIYDAAKRLSIAPIYPTLKCNGVIVTSKVGLLMVDEVAFAGNTYTNTNSSSYLKDNALLSYWIYSNNNEFESFYYDGLGGYISLMMNDSATEIAIRPSITLIAGVEVIDGNGTIQNPYVLN